MNDASTLLEMPLACEVALLQRIEAFNENAVHTVKGFLCDETFLAAKYNANLKKRNVDIGFNLFELISDHYYRETFHSDILNALLDPVGKHQERDKYLRLFLEYLCLQHGAKIDLTDYSNAEVVKEAGRIDVLIKDETSKRAIIIENKINDATDQPRQLPGYLKKVIDWGYVCDAIIYLRLNGYTPPDMTGWKDGEPEQVNAHLKVICAYDETEGDLLNGWIVKCEMISTNPDAKHILRQYGGIIKKLGGNIMNKPIMEEFYKIIVEGGKYKTALALKEMLDDLTSYRVQRIIDKFKSDADPFHRLMPYQNGALFQNLIFGEADFEMSVWVEDDVYWFFFLDRNDREGSKGRAKAMLQKMGCLDEYTYKDGHFGKGFQFPSQDNDLIEHIRAFKEKLGKVV
jgi:hypothetical protein